MQGFALTIGLFVLWWTLGYGFLSLVWPRRNVVQRMLLAPATGLAIVVVLVFLLNRAGLPIGRFGLWVTLALLVASLISLLAFKPNMALRACWPFAAVLGIAMVLTGRPMFEYGLHWLSYSNDDMANYILNAQRMFDHGFFDVPLASQMLSGGDYSLDYWFFDLHVRPGGEMVLAWVMSLTRLAGDQVYMPFMVALQLVLISSACALVYKGAAYRKPAIATGVLLAASANVSLGTLYQLLGQVGGLALLIGCGVALLHDWSEVTKTGSLMREGLVLGVIAAAMLIWYPEVSPFLALAFILHQVIMRLHGTFSLRRLAVMLGTGAVALLALVNTYLLPYFFFLMGQTSGAAVAGGPKSVATSTSLFPYYLLPSGLADLWGFQSITFLPDEPLGSLTIAIGGILTFLAAAAAVFLLTRGEPSAVFAVVMFALGGYLFIVGADFGLFKIAMYIQPFMLGALSVWWFHVVDAKGIKRQRVYRLWQGVPLLLIAVAGLKVQQTYVERSRGEIASGGGGLTEVPYASSADITHEFSRLLKSFPAQHYVLDTSNVVLAKFQALYGRGHSLIFPTQDFFSNIAGVPKELEITNPDLVPAAQSLANERATLFTNRFFDLHEPGNPNALDGFEVNKLPEQWNSQSTVLVRSAARQSIINRLAPTTNADFTAQPWDEAKNHLMFISSERGRNYYSGERRLVSFFQLESDPFFRGQTMSGIGRYLLFQVANPTDKVRVSLNFTASYRHDNSDKLPPVTAIGDTRVAFPLVGSGAAHVFSPPMVPQMINGIPYLALDMGLDGKQFPPHPTGLMNLYGSDIPFDRRFLVAFAREISLVSEDEYSSLPAPAFLDRFPADLINSQLEFSGIYEDGWLSDDAYVELSPMSGNGLLSLQGTVPSINGQPFSTTLQLLLDGHVVAERQVSVGDFTLDAPVALTSGRHRVEVRSSDLQALPGGDGRPVAARVNFVGFGQPNASSPNAQADIAPKAQGIALGQNWYSLETYGGLTFRWVDNDAQLLLNPPAGSTGLILDAEPGPGVGPGPMTLHVLDSRGNEATEETLSGRETFKVPLAEPGAPLAFRLHIDGGGLPTPNDSRTLNFRVFHLTWTRD